MVTEVHFLYHFTRRMDKKGKKYSYNAQTVFLQILKYSNLKKCKILPK